MSTDFGSIWDWLIENSRPKQLPPPAEPPRSNDEVVPSQGIDDLTLLALEREAEIAAKLRETP